MNITSPRHSSFRIVEKILVIFLPVIFFQTMAVAQSDTRLMVTATNHLAFGQMSQTIELAAEQLKPFGQFSYNKIHVRDAAGRELLCQAVDMNGDHRPDKVVFQADFGPNETRKFIVYIGDEHLYSASDYKTYGRFVRERFDDFAWENDRIAQRVYGPALKTTTFGPLASSALDIWPKRTSRLIINDWYMTDHYHNDTGDGADLYVSGKSRGVGGDGLWTNNKLWVSENYSSSQVLTTGPIRISFHLAYDAFEVNDASAKEEKDVTLDAGQNLNHFVIHYKTDKPGNFLAAAGIQTSKLSEEEVRKGLSTYNNHVPIERLPGAVIQQEADTTAGWFIFRQPVSEGEIYSAIIINPRHFAGRAQDANNTLVLSHLPSDNVFSYWAGYTWTRSGQFKNFEEWKTYIDHFAKRIQSPIEVVVSHTN